MQMKSTLEFLPALCKKSILNNTVRFTFPVVKYGPSYHHLVRCADCGGVCYGQAKHWMNLSMQMNKIRDGNRIEKTKPKMKTYII